MNSGTKNGIGAALQTVGQGLMQFTQFNIEEQRQKNLEMIRQRERGEEKAERDARFQTEDARYQENANFQKERAAKEDSYREQRDKQEAQFRGQQMSEARKARLDAKEMKILDNYESIPSAYSRRLEMIDKAELDGTTTPDQILKARTQVAREIAARQEDFVRRHPFLKGYTVSDYIGGGDAAPAAETPPAGEAAPPASPDGKKPLPAGLMAPTTEAAAPTAAALAVEKAGLQPTESVVDIAKEAVSSAATKVASTARAAKDGWGNANALADVRYVMNRLTKTGSIPIETVESIAKSTASEDELRKAGADDRVIKIIRDVRSSL